MWGSCVDPSILGPVHYGSMRGVIARRLTLHDDCNMMRRFMLKS
jgi:hypothetical protein